MRVTSLTLDSFRNYESLELNFGPGVTLFLGRNGQGKTNIVEAIHFASQLGSHRVQTLDALIREGSERAVIRLTADLAERSISADFELNRGKPNRAQLNRKPVYAREIPKLFHAVLFSPEDLTLIKGEPGVRRKFIDETAAKLSVGYPSLLIDYDRALKQRNALLKLIRAERRSSQHSELELWNETISSLGSRILQSRVQLLQRIEPEIAASYRFFTDEEQRVTVRYEMTALQQTAAPAELAKVSETTLQQQYRELLNSREQQDIERGQTSIGPHRDDVHFFLNDLPVKGYASHGETWSYALAIKLATAEIFRRSRDGDDPVLILDDVFAELDEGRREKLATGISGFEQVLITAAVRDDVPDQLIGSAVHIAAGRVVAPETGSPQAVSDQPEESVQQ